MFAIISNSGTNMYFLLLSDKFFKIKSGISGSKSVNRVQLFDTYCQTALLGDDSSLNKCLLWEKIHISLNSF